MAYNHGICLLLCIGHILVVSATSCYSCTFETINGQVVDDDDINCRDNPHLTYYPTESCAGDCFEIQHTRISQDGEVTTFIDRRCRDVDDLEYGLVTLDPDTCVEGQDFVDLVEEYNGENGELIKGSACRCSGELCNNSPWTSTINAPSPATSCYSCTFETVNGQVVDDDDINCRNNPHVTAFPTEPCAGDCFEIQYTRITQDGLNVTWIDRWCYDYVDDLERYEPDTCIEGQDFLDFLEEDYAYGDNDDLIKGSACRCSEDLCNNRPWNSTIEPTTCYSCTYETADQQVANNGDINCRDNPHLIPDPTQICDGDCFEIQYTRISQHGSNSTFSDRICHSSAVSSFSTLEPDTCVEGQDFADLAVGYHGENDAFKGSACRCSGDLCNNKPWTSTIAIETTSCYSCTYETAGQQVANNGDINCRDNPHLIPNPTQICDGDCFEIQYTRISQHGSNLTFTDRVCHDVGDLKFGLDTLEPDTCVEGQDFADLVKEYGGENDKLIKGSACRCSGDLCNRKPWTSTIASSSRSSSVVVVAVSAAGASVAVIVIILLIVVVVVVVKKSRGHQNDSEDQEDQNVKSAYEVTIFKNKAFNVDEVDYDDVDEYDDTDLADKDYEEVTSSKWDIAWKDLSLSGKILGKGNFGEVQLGKVRTKDKWIKAAVKTLKECTPESEKALFKKEFDTMTKIGYHPNVVNILGSCEYEGSFYVVLEYVPHGNLRKFLRKSRNESKGEHKKGSVVSHLNSDQLFNFVMGVAKAMKYISSCGIIHRDLAARNVLVGRGLTSKVADFGMSRGENEYIQTSSQRVPTRWLSIESLNRKTYTTKSDVWSFGILLWEIATFGGTPYLDMETKYLAYKLTEGYRMPKPDNCENDMYALMLKCWQADPDDRPSFKEIVDILTDMQSQEKIYMSTQSYMNFKYAGISRCKDDK